MAIFLFIDPQILVKETVISNNVDTSKYLFSIENTQITVLEPLFGSELYDKLKEDYINDTLSGDYLTLYNEYLVPILKYQSAAEYIEVCSYMVENGGIFKHTITNGEVVERDEVYKFAERYRSMSQMYVERFNKWICKNPLEEYKTYQEEVNASTDLSVKGGFYFGNAQTRNKWD